MLERTSLQKIRFFKVIKRDAQTLIQLIIDNVGPGSIIYFDGWRGYIGLSNYGFRHFVVNHIVTFVDHKTGIHTNTIEGNWSGLKKYVLLIIEGKDTLIFIYHNLNVDVFLTIT